MGLAGGVGLAGGAFGGAMAQLNCNGVSGRRIQRSGAARWGNRMAALYRSGAIGAASLRRNATQCGVAMGRWDGNAAGRLASLGGDGDGI